MSILKVSRSDRKGARAFIALKGVPMQDDAEREQNDLNVAPDRPMLEILKIGLKPVGKIGLDQSCTPEATNLGEPGQPGFGSMAVPVALIDVPKQLVCSTATKRVGTGTDDAHVALKNVEELGKLVDAGRANESSNTGNAIIIAGS